MGEAHGKYAPAGPAPLGLTPPTRPQPRAAVLVSLAHDPEAAAVRRRLEARGWQVAQCDAALGPLAASVADGRDALGSPPRPGAASASRRRLSQLRRAAHEPRLRAAAGRLLVGGAGGSPKAVPKGLGLTAPLCGAGGEGGGGGGGGSGGDEAGAEEELSELSLLWAVSSLPSLDVLLLLLPDDERNLRLCRLLTRSASFLAAVHQRQTSAPQLVVRLVDPSSEAAYQAEAPSLAPFRLTLAGTWAAMPNLLAEMLHPTSHWSLHVDNDVAPASARGSPAAPEQAKIRRSCVSAESASELQGAPLFARTDSASSV